MPLLTWIREAFFAIDQPTLRRKRRRKRLPVAAQVQRLEPRTLLSGTTILVSQADPALLGSTAHGHSLNSVSMSGDGRFVAFLSQAGDLADGDANGRYDVFVLDRQTDQVERISVGQGGAESNSDSVWIPRLSADGRFVAFVSNASNLVSGDTNNTIDLFVYDRQTHVMDRVTAAAGASVVSAGSSTQSLSISADGRFVAFDAYAWDLVSDDTNGTPDVFVFDRTSRLLERVSVGAGGVQGNGHSARASLSDDGRYVSFESAATNLVAGDSSAAADVFVHDRATGVTERVSVNAAGAEANGSSGYADLSSDGRYVVFVSSATNLVEGDTNGVADVFVLDRTTGQVDRVSVGPEGAQANGGANTASISADGRFVAFSSMASNLIAGDAANTWDLFVFDRTTRQAERVNVGNGGVAVLWSLVPAISDNGRFAAFVSNADNVVDGDLNRRVDVFLRDRQNQTTEIVSARHAAVAVSANRESYGGAVSADGRFVAFVSNAGDLHAASGGGVQQIYVFDRQTGRQDLVSANSAGVAGNGLSYMPSLSADGRFVTFSSAASNLIAGDTNGAIDQFVLDRQTRVIERVSVGTGTAQSNGFSEMGMLSADGRFVVFRSIASNLVANDTNGIVDIFVFDRTTRLTERVTVGAGGVQANGSNSVWPVISANGRFVAFISSASNLISGDTNGSDDVFVFDRVTRQTDRVSVRAGDVQTSGTLSYGLALSADGQFVSYVTSAPDLVAGDTNNTYDVFVFNRAARTTERVSVGAGGAQANGASYAPTISADGRFILFHSYASNLVAGDTGNSFDTFLFDRQTRAIERIAPYSGYYYSYGWGQELSADGRSVAFTSWDGSLVAGDGNGTYDVFLWRRSGAPSALSLPVASVAENRPSGTAVGTLFAVDDDQPAQLLYSLVAGQGDADNARFAIVGDELRTAAPLDFEAQSSQSIRVRVTDTDGLTFEQVLSVTVTDVNEAPSVALQVVTPSIAENTPTPTRTKVADVLVTDDALGNETLSLAGADAARFELIGTELFLRAGVALNFEAQGSYQVTVNVDDPTLAPNPDASASMTLGVIDVNEPPSVALTNALTRLPENASTATRIRVADIVVTDDALGSESLTLTGDDAALFEIDAGSLWLKAGTLLDQIGNPLLTVAVQVDDATVGGAPDGTAPLSILVSSVVPDGPETLVATNAEIVYGWEGSQPVAMDADGDSVIVYSKPVNSDGSGHGVFGRRFTSDGVAAGGEFRVNTWTTNEQMGASVAMDADGDFVVVWSSIAQDPEGYGVYAQRYDAAGTPVGGEFRVNTWTTNYQYHASVAMDADGDFVVAWVSNLQDGAATGVYAQRFDRQGRAVGGEFRVNVATAGDQKSPCVAMDAAGNFVITWASPDGWSDGVFARRYAADGTPLSSEFRVNVSTVSFQYRPEVKMDADGDFVVIWIAPYAGSSMIAARRYDRAGNAVGSEFRVDTGFLTITPTPSLAMEPDGDFIVAWENNSGSGGNEVFAQRFSGAGEKLGAQWRVNTITTGHQNSPGIAVDADGDFTVVWQSWDPTQSGTWYGVYAQRYNEIADNAGATVTDVLIRGLPLTEGERQLAAVDSITVRVSEALSTAEGTAGPGSVLNPENWRLLRDGTDASWQIASISFGLNPTTRKYEAVVTFSSPLSGGDYVLTLRSTVTDVAGNAFDGNTDGSPGGDFSRGFTVAVPQALGTDFRVNSWTTSTQETQIYRAVASDAAGNFVVVWASNGQDGSSRGIYGQRHDRFGATVGSEFRVNTWTFDNQTQASVSMDADGDFVVSWTSAYQDGSQLGVYAQRFDRFGAKQGSEFRVNTYTTGYQQRSSVALDADGDFVITWQSSYQDGSSTAIIARRYDRTGAQLGAEFVVNTWTTNLQGDPSVAIDADGDFVIVWASYGQDSGTNGVYGQRFDRNGIRAGGEFKVHSQTNGSQSLARVAMDSDGEFVVTWTDDTGFLGDVGYGIRARMFSADGTPLSSEFRVNETTTHFQRFSDVGMDADGNFVITWSNQESINGVYDIYARRYNRAGNPLGSEFRLNAWTTGEQRYSHVAVDADGDFVIVWTSAAQDGSGDGVFARRFARGTPPTDLGLSSSSLVENLPSGTVVGTLTATDSDSPESFTWALVPNEGSADNAGFEIVGNALLTTRSFDYEAQTTASVRVQVTDAGGLSFSKALTITIGNANDPPTVALTNIVTALTEDVAATARVKVADVVVGDDNMGTPDLLLAGADSGLFELVGAVLYLRAGTVVDFALNPVLDVTVRVDDPNLGSTFEASVDLAIAVIDVNAPPLLALQNAVASLPENADTSARVRIADLSVTDDGPASLAFTLAGPHADLFEISNGSLWLKAETALDFEVEPALTVDVRVHDPALGEASASVRTHELNLTDVNEAPRIAVFGVVPAVPEDLDVTERFKVADVIVIDDALGTNGLSLSGDDAAYFELDGRELFLRAGAPLDFEARPALNVTIRVDDPALGGPVDASVDFALAVTDANDPPGVQLANAVTTLPENVDTGGRVKVADILITDDTLGANTLSLSGPDAALFELEGTELFLGAGVRLDFEARPTLQVTVEVDDADVGEAPDGTATLTIGVTDVVELPPAVSGFSGSVTYSENAVPVLIDTSVTVTDPDSPDFGGGLLTVSVSQNADGHDRLGIRHQGGAAGQIGVVGDEVRFGGVPIGVHSGGADSVPLEVAFNSNASAAAVRALIQNLVFSNDSDAPGTAPRQLVLTLRGEDGMSSVPVAKTVSVTPKNDASTITGFGGSVAFVEGAGAVPLDDDAIVSDVDSPNLATGRLTVRISANGHADDRLTIRNEGTAPGQIGVAGTGVLFGGVVVATFTGGKGTAPLTVTFNAGSSPAAAQAVLRNVTFENVSSNPTTLTRTVQATLTDGDGGTSAVATKTVTVVPVNTAASVAAFDGTVAWLKGGAPVLVDADATVADPDSANFAGGSMILSIDAGSEDSDRLRIRHQGTSAGQVGVAGADVLFGGNRIGSWTGGDGATPLAVTFDSAAASLAAVQTLIRNLTYAGDAAAPTVAPRIVSITVNDGDGATSSLVTKTVQVASNTVIGGWSGSVQYTENGAPLPINTSVTIADPDTTHFGGGTLTLSITQNASPDDLLSIRDQGVKAGLIGVSGTDVSFGGTVIGNLSGGLGGNSLVITLNANATQAAVKALIQNLSFSNGSDDPSAGPRVVEVVLTDPQGTPSGGMSKTVVVVPRNDAPTLGGFSDPVTYSTATGPALIAPAATLVDPDSPDLNAGRLTIQLTNNVQSTDRLLIRDTGTGPGEIGVSGNAVTFGGTTIATFKGGNGRTALVITFNANATPTAVQALLRNIEFSSTLLGPSTLPRTLKATLTDGDGGTSAPVTRTINVT